LGKNVGNLKVMLGLGSPIQVNRQIERENEKRQEQVQLRIAEERAQMQQEVMTKMSGSAANGGANLVGQGERMKELIRENNEEKQKEEEEAMERNPLLGQFVHQGSPSMKRKNPAEKFANALRQSLTG